MSDQTIKLSEKYKDFLSCKAPVEFLEGTTYAGKTTVGAFKFILKCFASPKKLHVLAAKDTGIAEKNIINKDLGILDNFSEDLVEYRGQGSSNEKLPHLLLHGRDGDKIVYILGYSSREKWEKALGGQYGCLYIDEINTANLDFVQEAAMRCDYLMATLNPDDPALPVYEQYVNCSRPLPKWAHETPQEILDALCEEEKPGWVHWFFSFKDNLGLTDEKREQVMVSVPKGTKRYKNKILGLRGKATGLVFSNFDRKVHVVAPKDVRELIKKPNGEQDEWFTEFSAGCDTSYSSNSEDTISFAFWGFTNKGRAFKLDERVYNNKNLDTPLAPSDTVENLVDFLERNRKQWGFARTVFIDSADQATITEAAKYKARRGTVYEFEPAWKKTPIIDRIYLQLGWMAHDGEKSPSYFVLNTCVNTIYELEVYSWREDKDNTPEDGHDHCINADQYAWLPWKKTIGVR